VRTLQRICAVKGCSRILSASVPEHVILCSYHQYLELEKLRLVKRLAEEFCLSGADRKFLLENLDWNYTCSCSALAKYLAIPYVTFWGYIQKGSVSAQKRQGCWFLSAAETVRAISLVRNWISIGEAAKMAKVDNSSLRVWVKAGYFGPVSKTLGKCLAIRTKILPNLAEECQKIKTVRRKWANRNGRFLKEGEIGTSEIAQRFGVTQSAVCQWIQQGKIKAKKRHGCWVVQAKDLKIQ